MEGEIDPETSSGIKLHTKVESFIYTVIMRQTQSPNAALFYNK